MNGILDNYNKQSVSNVTHEFVPNKHKFITHLNSNLLRKLNIGIPISGDR